MPTFTVIAADLPNYRFTSDTLESVDIDKAAKRAVDYCPPDRFVVAVVQSDQLENLREYLRWPETEPAREDKARSLRLSSPGYPAHLSWYDSPDGANRRRVLTYLDGHLYEVEREHPSDTWPPASIVNEPDVTIDRARRIALHRGLLTERDNERGTERPLIELVG